MIARCAEKSGGISVRRRQQKTQLVYNVMLSVVAYAKHPTRVLWPFCIFKCDGRFFNQSDKGGDAVKPHAQGLMIVCSHSLGLLLVTTFNRPRIHISVQGQEHDHFLTFVRVISRGFLLVCGMLKQAEARGHDEADHFLG